VDQDHRYSHHNGVAAMTGLGSTNPQSNRDHKEVLY